MPRYDFQCKTCGAIFEQTRTFATATDPTACPTCGAVAHRLLRMPTLVRSGFSAPDPGEHQRSSETSDDIAALDPTKPHPAWEAMSSGCPCCPGGRHRPIQLPDAAGVD